MIASNQPSISGGYYGIHRFYVAHPYGSVAKKVWVDKIFAVAMKKRSLVAT